MSEILFHEQLGRGGYGEVYRATVFREEREHMVAVKVLNASVQDGSDAQRRLRDEARVLGAIHHPNILRVHDLADLDGHVAMIAEYVPGEDLDRCVLDGLPPRALVEVIGQVASALAAAWNCPNKVTGKPLQLVHRDIKPENLRVRPDGRVKILDFGVALAMELRREAQTATNTVMGSFRYMAPERFDSGLVPHPSVDVFALGCILYEGLVYRRLFEHLSMREMMVLSIPGYDRYSSYIAERLEELPDTTEARVINLIHRLVERDPALRPMPDQLAEIALDLARRLPGPGLADWCAARDWPRPRSKRGAWSGRRQDLPMESEFLTAYPGDEDYTPTPESFLRPTSDFDLIDELLPPDLETQPFKEALSAPPLPRPAPRRELPEPDEVTLNHAVDSLNDATSTPVGPAPRPPESTPRPAALPEPPPSTDPPANAPLPTEAIDVEALRQGIGIQPSADTPDPAPVRPSKRAQRDTVVANLVALGVLAVLGLVAVGLAALVALS